MHCLLSVENLDCLSHEILIVLLSNMDLEADKDCNWDLF